MITAAEIRETFLKYFENKGHIRQPSSSLIPRDDPSLLFTNAGMVQFKKIFQGQEQRAYSRATTSQKCLRVGGKHNDLENVGRTARHHTFFEMLGNFSFGDYFKEQAISFAWEFITKELGLPKEKLYATVYKDDDEAFELWKKVAGLPESRIYRLGEKDNFWSMGDTGPCGPCSELHIDQGEHMACGPDCGIGKCDCDRFLEIWNLVFMQFNRDETGTMTPLPKPSIDTGMGLERIAAVCQGVYSNFDTDLFVPLITAMADRAGVQYGESDDTDTALRVIADHSRSMAFLIADGILPSNEGRGYVLRRLIRRAFRFGRLMGMEQPFLYEQARAVVKEMGSAFPELLDNQDFMVSVIKKEEERFSQTLDKGLAILEQEMDRVRHKGGQVLSGEVAFKLYDTYGFPLDIVNDVTEKQGMSVDEAGFNTFMAEQKRKSKEAWSGSGEKDVAAQFARLLEAGMQTRFVGYDTLCATSRIVTLLDATGQSVDVLSQGDHGYILTAQTPFYGESGGQTGDQGALTTPTGSVQVVNTLKPSPQLIVHEVEISKGEVTLDQEAALQVEEGVRIATARNHTCTHLLQAALQKVLGKHVKQSGSLVTPERLRFDFTHIAAMTPEEIARVEDEVNASILANVDLTTQIMSLEEAKAKDAMALFGEKYDQQVRVVEVPGISVELCGGTHLKSTGQAGSFCILSESGIASGVRRIEALTGWEALKHWKTLRAEHEQIARELKSQPGELVARVHSLKAQLKELSRENKSLQEKLLSSQGRDLMQGVEEINGVKVLTIQTEAQDVNALRTLMDDLRSKLTSGVIALTAHIGEKVVLLLFVSKDLHDRFTAPGLIKPVAAAIGGGGGGRPDLAQAGGTDPSGIDKAFARLRELVGA
ncbi:alanine--tRNA ligase [Desulfoplanes formicivorans]|uniref:Alanine--tRNA ligase n=1 Tax=Desulfoplanes formicivorans TaxID=1592317 RepID=A0A194AH61_9BACT|nr:alanine--tRNA ligase [Desulfoplanes formicivorans]GAU08663.1 alanyl-tRNA synthetase [Desulfoplanes formicivorans]